MPRGWEGNRRSGVALAMRHRLLWFNSTRHAKLYPQHGDRIVTIDSVTSLHPMYNYSVCRVAEVDGEVIDSQPVFVNTYFMFVFTF